MCFGALIDGDATEKPLRELLRDETGSALKNAGVTTVTVGLVLALAGGVALPLVAAAAAVAFLAGVLLHLAVLVVGAAVVRWRARPDEQGMADATAPRAGP
ncbi:MULTISPECIES: hypothetical protein [Salinibaculum]|uniref:hypothetical protein n=1 Tax=Salinibaculum TaxID=2732368 RepID=UPI0030CBBC40